MTLSSEVEVVQVLTDDPDEPDLAAEWSRLVEEPLGALKVPAPRLTVIRSPYRELFEPLLAHVLRTLEANRHRRVIVVLPQSAPRHWWQALIGTHRATILHQLLLIRGGPGLAVVTVPWYEGARDRARAKVILDHDPGFPSFGRTQR